jgi:hypothetical protein
MPQINPLLTTDPACWNNACKRAGFMILLTSRRDAARQAATKIPLAQYSRRGAESAEKNFAENA